MNLIDINNIQDNDQEEPKNHFKKHSQFDFHYDFDRLFINKQN